MAPIQGWARRWWIKSRLSFSMLMILFKCALAPTIALCLLLNPRVAAYLGPVGYLTAILSINPVLPQGQYVELIAQQVCSVCLATSVTLLQLFCVTKAREHTSQPLPPPPSNGPPPPPPYNSSASAVSGIWLVVLVFAVCFLRSAKPQLTMPCINFTVVVVVTSSVAPLFPNMSAAITFARELLVINLIGLALSAAVNMIIWPTTNRGAYERSLVQLRDCTRNCLTARANFLSNNLLSGTSSSPDKELSPDVKREVNETHNHDDGLLSPAAATARLLAVLSNMETQLTYAKRELSIGKLDAGDLTYIQNLISNIIQPVLGLLSGAEYVQKSSSDSADGNRHQILLRERERELEGHDILINALTESLKVLGIYAKYHSRRRSDEESAGVILNTLPNLRARLEALEHTRLDVVEELKSEEERRDGEVLDNHSRSETSETVVYMVLMSQELMHDACTAAIDLLEFASKRRSGFRLILPSFWKQKHPKWDVRSAVSKETGPSEIYKKEPEHLQPRNTLQRLGKTIFRISNVLRSPHAGFAVRIAAAVLSAEILAFLRQTQRWYTEERVVWTSITIAVVTVRTAGQSVFGVLCQVLGTLMGCLLSLVVWYIVDQHIPGVIVFYLLAMMIALYPMQRNAALLPLSLVGAVTLTLLIGYTIEFKRIGQIVVLATGAPYYPPYILAWLDLLAVLAGVGIALFWTIFPYPNLETAELRDHLSEAINMIAALHVRTHSAVYSRIKGEEVGKEIDYETRQQEDYASLQRQIIQRVAALQQLLSNAKYQIQIGGRFPRDTYSAILGKIESSVRSMSTVHFAMRTFDRLDSNESNSIWLQEMRRYAAPNDEYELRTVSALAVCAIAISKTQPLPRYIDVPETSTLLESIKKSPMQLMHVKHAAEPGYAALATVHACAFVVTDDIRQLLRLTAQLTGEVSFDTSIE